MTAAKDQHFVPDETAKDVIDKALQFGKYQSLLIWIFGTSIGNPLVSKTKTLHASLFQLSSGPWITSNWSSC